MKILIVDDKVENLLMLETLLQGNGYDVDKAHNGEIALEILKGDSFQMIISDILMPVMDGYDLCRICKNDPELRNIIFIFYTATYTDADDEKYALQLGADHFLIKPMEPEAFLSEIYTITKNFDTNQITAKEPTISDLESLKKHRDRLLNKLGKKIDELELEIYQRKAAESRIQKSLKEKEILLRELYHRTKNNMQVISSMMRIRSRNIDNPEMKDILHDLENKIIAMAIAHQILYESEDLSRLNLRDYYKKLISLIRNTYLGTNDRIMITFQGEDIYVLIDTAIPCGLILSELLTNSIRHAFPDRQGNVQVNLRLSNRKELVIEISDNGIGLPDHFNLDAEKHIGLKSVYNLVEHQLQGLITTTSHNGLKHHISIKEELYDQRI